MAFRNQLIQIN